MWEKLTRRPIGTYGIICCFIIAILTPAWLGFEIVSSQLRPGETILQAEVLGVEQKEYTGRLRTPYHHITCVYHVELEDKRTYYRLSDQKPCIAGIGGQAPIAESDNGEVRIYNPHSWTRIIWGVPFALAGIFGATVGIAARQRAIREGRDPEWGGPPEAKED